ncbi:Methionyl-tRNA formyltransferase [termite gut metagenome]|uniref:Methionyl-tRNA formyltransferase n=1 Tax=termite gut metagenome TaxID=433724 RepID=A0A5J4S182_9ZZZZ
MIIKIYSEKSLPACIAAKVIVAGLGHVVTENAAGADLAIAPLLTEILPLETLRKPRYGTLIFHPSPLPYGRGASAIRYAYKRNEPVTAATWFWANKGIDAGDICEQEIVKIDYNLRPREFYEKDIIPAMSRTLERALIALSKGIVRRIPQIERYATYDKKL